VITKKSHLIRSARAVSDHENSRGGERSGG
jgi:hypothetical protein